MLFSSIRVTGLLPYSIVVFHNKHPIIRLRKGWCYVTTWWFVVVTLAQLIWTPTMNFYIIFDVISSVDSTFYFSVLLIWLSTYFVVKLVPLLLVFHASRLTSVLETFGQVDKALKNISQSKPSNVKSRTAFGIITGCILVLYGTSQRNKINDQVVVFTAYRCSFRWVVNVHKLRKTLWIIPWRYRYLVFGIFVQATIGDMVIAVPYSLLLHRPSHIPP